jgi:prepilin-type processing-associated H-X9-DG protein
LWPPPTWVNSYNTIWDETKPRHSFQWIDMQKGTYLGAYNISFVDGHVGVFHEWDDKSMTRHPWEN